MCTEKRGQILTTYWLLRSRYINMRGIWSNSSLSVPSEYGATLGDDFVAGNCSTFLTVYLPEPTSYYTQLYAVSYADSGMFTPEISADGRTLKLGYIYQESESGGIETVEKTARFQRR